MFRDKIPLSQCIDMENHAIEQLRAGNAPESAFEILSYMGYLQSRMGNYSEALVYMQEADDSLKTMPPGSVDQKEIVMFLGNLSNYYVRLHLFDEALTKNHEATALAKTSAPGYLADLWRMRGVCFKFMNRLDSAEVCNDKAILCATEIKDPLLRDNSIAFCECNKAWFYIEHPDYAPDSIASAVALIERNIGKYPQIDNTNLFLAGRGRVLLGDYDKGLAMMERALATLRGERDDLESTEFFLRLLADSYAEAGNRRLFDIYKETAALHDTLLERQREDVLLGKDFQYRISELHAEKERLADALSVSRQRNFLIVIVSLMMIIGLTEYFIGKIKRQRRHLKENQERIDHLIGDRIFLNTKIEELNAELQSKSGDDELITPLPTVILDKDSEQQFRNIFSELHPGFLENLRRDYPSLTSGNELLCMLIRLYKSNDEIAQALGISRESVITSRYRLRSRFNLSKDTDLNDFIQSR